MESIDECGEKKPEGATISGKSSSISKSYRTHCLGVYQPLCQELSISKELIDDGKKILMTDSFSKNSVYLNEETSSDHWMKLHCARVLFVAQISSGRENEISVQRLLEVASISLLELTDSIGRYSESLQLNTKSQRLITSFDSRVSFMFGCFHEYEQLFHYVLASPKRSNSDISSSDDEKAVVDHLKKLFIFGWLVFVYAKEKLDVSSSVAKVVRLMICCVRLCIVHAIPITIHPDFQEPEQYFDDDDTNNSEILRKFTRDHAILQSWRYIMQHQSRAFKKILFETEQTSQLYYSSLLPMLDNFITEDFRNELPPLTSTNLGFALRLGSTIEAIADVYKDLLENSDNKNSNNSVDSENSRQIMLDERIFLSERVEYEDIGKYVLFPVAKWRIRAYGKVSIPKVPWKVSGNNIDNDNNDNSDSNASGDVVMPIDDDIDVDDDSNNSNIIGESTSTTTMTTTKAHPPARSTSAQKWVDAMIATSSIHSLVNKNSGSGFLTLSSLPTPLKFLIDQYCPVEGNERRKDRILQILHRLVNVRITNESQQNNSDIQEQSASLFVRIGSQMIKNEGSSSIAKLISNDVFLRSLAVFCLHVVLSALVPFLDPTAIELCSGFGIFAFEYSNLFSIVAPIIGGIQRMPRTLSSQLVYLDERIVECDAWKDDSPLWAYVRRMESKLKNIVAEENAADKATPPSIPPSNGPMISYEYPLSPTDRTVVLSTTAIENWLLRFLQNIGRISHERIDALCERLMLFHLKNNVIALINEILNSHYSLLKNRHMRQIILCSIFAVAKLSDENLSFRKLHDAHNELFPDDSWIFNGVSLDIDDRKTNSKKGGTGGLISFYNDVFLPTLRQSISMLWPQTSVFSTPTRSGSMMKAPTSAVDSLPLSNRPQPLASTVVIDRDSMISPPPTATMTSAAAMSKEQQSSYVLQTPVRPDSNSDLLMRLHTPLRPLTALAADAGIDTTFMSPSSNKMVDISSNSVESSCKYEVSGFESPGKRLREVNRYVSTNAATAATVQRVQKQLLLQRQREVDINGVRYQVGGRKWLMYSGHTQRKILPKMVVPGSKNDTESTAAPTKSNSADATEFLGVPGSPSSKRVKVQGK